MFMKILSTRHPQCVRMCKKAHQKIRRKIAFFFSHDFYVKSTVCLQNVKIYVKSNVISRAHCATQRRLLLSCCLFTS